MEEKDEQNIDLNDLDISLDLALLHSGGGEAKVFTLSDLNQLLEEEFEKQKKVSLKFFRQGDLKLKTGSKAVILHNIFKKEIEENSSNFSKQEPYKVCEAVNFKYYSIDGYSSRAIILVLARLIRRHTQFNIGFKLGETKVLFHRDMKEGQNQKGNVLLNIIRPPRILRKGTIWAPDAMSKCVGFHYPHTYRLLEQFIRPDRNRELAVFLLNRAPELTAFTKEEIKCCVEFQYQHDSDTISALQHLLNFTLFLHIHCEVSRRVYAEDPTANKRDITETYPLAFSQIRSLRLIAGGVLKFSNVYGCGKDDKTGAAFGPTTGTDISNRSREIREKMHRINQYFSTSELQSLDDEKDKPSGKNKNSKQDITPLRYLISSRENLHQELLEYYGGATESEGKAYRTTSSSSSSSSSSSDDEEDKAPIRKKKPFSPA